MSFLSSFSENVSAFFSADPSVLLVQSVTSLTVCIVVFLVLFALRDILLRTHSFVYQVFCILLVAALPVVGFFLYLLIRPSQTIAERNFERKITQYIAKSEEHHGKKHHSQEKKGQK